MLANKVWRNITIRQIRQTLVPPNFHRLRYLHTHIDTRHTTTTQKENFKT